MSNKQQGLSSAGFMLMKPLVETATQLGVRSVYDVRVQSLIVESDGRVVGITARQFGSDIAVRAAAAWSWPPELRLQRRDGGAVRAPDRRQAGGVHRTARRCRHPDGQALGADLAHMDATEVAIFIEPQQLVRGILVNARGQRYVAEDTYPGRIGQLTLYHQDNTAYLIIDGDAQEEAMAAPSPHLMMRPPTSVCETVAELEAEIGLPPVRCRPRSSTTTPAPSAARIRCCTRRPSGCGPSVPRWAPSTCATAPAGSPSAGWRPRCPARCCTSGRADPRPVRRRALHRWPGRVGLCQRRLPRRRQLLRPPRRPCGCRRLGRARRRRHRADDHLHTGPDDRFQGGDVRVLHPVNVGLSTDLDDQLGRQRADERFGAEVDAMVEELGDRIGEVLSPIQPPQPILGSSMMSAMNCGRSRPRRSWSPRW